MLTKPKTKTIQVRVTEDDYEYLKEMAYMMGTDASKYVRQVIQMSINAAKAAKAAIEKENEKMKDKDKLVNDFKNMESEVEVIADRC